MTASKVDFLRTARSRDLLFERDAILCLLPLRESMKGLRTQYRR
jgi:hypothetical protein